MSISPDDAEVTARVEILRAAQCHTVRQGGLVFAARHNILIDFATDLARTIPDGFPLRATILVGLHLFWDLPQVPGPLLGIQTEHNFDDKGQEIWKFYPEPRLRRHCPQLTAILDLSFANAPAYDALRPDRRQRVIYGPYVFPSQPEPFRARGDAFVFVGNTAGRRSEILDDLSKRFHVEVIPRRTFGQELSERILRSKGVINIHSTEGVYTEVPRLLKAVLGRKTLLSEPLAWPFVANRHYHLLDNVGVKSLNREQVYSNFSREIARTYSFTNFLSMALG